jgi:hypothetical protein
MATGERFSVGDTQGPQCRYSQLQHCGGECLLLALAVTTSPNPSDDERREAVATLGISVDTGSQWSVTCTTEACEAKYLEVTQPETEGPTVYLPQLLDIGSFVAEQAAR